MTDAYDFLARLAPDGQFTFQTFDDTGEQRSALARILHGDLGRLAWRLKDLNDQRAGIFLMINRGDGLGRRTENVVGVRAVFIDLDGAPLEPVTTSAVHPDIVVESSPGRFHCYWPVVGCALERFRVLQQALAAKFNGDPVVHDLPRVMRIPGFCHQKGAPFLIRVLHLRNGPPHDVDELAQRLDLKAPEPRPPEPIGEVPAYQGFPGSGYGPTALDRAAHNIAAAPKGQQNRTLNAEAFSIGQLVAGGLLPERQAHDTLVNAAMKMVSHDDNWPWLPQKIEAMIDRGFSQAATKPRRPA